jgi:hypothetical protein
LSGDKFIKNLLIGIGIVLLISGQLILLNGAHIVPGVIFTVLAVLFFTLALTGKYAVIILLAAKIREFSDRRALKMAEMKIQSAKKADAPAIKKNAFSEKEEVLSVRKENVITAFLKPLMSNNLVFETKFVIPKWMLFTFVAVLFGAAQLLFFRDSAKMAILIIVVDVLLLISIIVMKDPGFTVAFKLENGFKILSLIVGFILAVIGWFFLIDQNIDMQQIGVAFTVPGAVLMFLGLPKSDSAVISNTDRTDIIFLKSKIFDNYIIKVLLLIASFVMLKIGVSVMNNQNYNMYSMMFYILSIVLVFFAMPLFNFPEKRYDNRIIDFIKLGAVIAAIGIAYKGQALFVANNVSGAMNYYFIAALIFVFAFPVYSVKEKEEKEPFPLKVEIIFLIAIIAVGAFLRFYQLDSRPFGIENDEAGGLLTRIARNGDSIPYPVGSYGILFHITQLFIALFGVGIERMPIKVGPAIIGIISIPAVYFFIRRIFNPRAAIFAAVVFTFLRWGVYYSRYSSPVIISLCAEAMAFYFFFLAIDTKKKLAWFMTGMCIGLTWIGPMTFFLILFPFIIYFIISAFYSKGYIKANMVGILAFLFGFWIFGSMTLHNYFISKSIYFSRVNEVSVFSKDPNAPSKNPAKGIVYNTKTVLLMFNHMGDSRQRNSGGQPYTPTVDFLTSMLFAIGLLYSAYYSKYYQFFIMLLVFLSQAAGSIFSIEAPSAMRAVGTMIPLFYFVSFTFDRIWIAFRRALGKKLEILYLPLILLVFLIPIAKENYDQYFNHWIGGMDELATAAGKYSKKLGNKTWILLYTSLYYPGHPPFKFYRWDNHAHSGPILTRGLMWLKDVKDDENFAILFHYDTWDNIENIKAALFPDSVITTIDHHSFNSSVKPGEGLGVFFKVIDVTSAQIQKMRGLTAEYSYGGPARANEDTVFLKADAGKVPYRVEWKGDILIPYYGKYRLYNNGTGRVSIIIDGHAMPPDKEAVLAEGFHRIAVIAFRNSINDTLDMAMVCKKLVDGEDIAGTEIVHLNKNYYYNIKVMGLHGYFYKDELWANSPLSDETINLNLSPLTGGGIEGKSVAWKGSVTVPEADVYRFIANTNGYTRIILDGKYYWEIAGGGISPEQIAGYFKNRKLVKVNDFRLSAGRHSLEIYCSGASTINLQWSRGLKNYAVSPVPIDALEPDFQITQN